MFEKMSEEEKAHYLKILLERKRMSVSDVLDRYDINKTLLHNIKKKYDIKSEKGTNIKWFSKRLLIELMEKGFSRTDLEEVFKCKKSLIEKGIKVCGVNYMRPELYRLFKHRDDIENDHESGMTVTELSEKYGSARETIKKFMEEHGIRVVNHKHHNVMKGVTVQWLTDRNQKSTVSEIAEELGIPSYVIYNRFKRSGLKVIDHRKIKDPRLEDEEWLTRKHHQERLSCREIGEEIGCSASVINRALIRNGVEPRNPVVVVDDRITNENWLKVKHIDERLDTGELADFFGCSPSTIRKRVNTIGVTPQGYTDAVSQQEQDLFDYINQIHVGEVVANSRKIIPPKEVDIYIPDLQLAIEYNGVYWHSSDKKEKTYHSEKWKMLHEKGIDLLTVWENDFCSDRDKISQMLIGFIEDENVDLSLDDTDEYLRFLNGNDCIAKFKKETGGLSCVFMKGYSMSVYKMLGSYATTNNLCLKLDTEKVPVLKIIRETEFTNIRIGDVIERDVFFNGKTSRLYGCPYVFLS